MTVDLPNIVPAVLDTPDLSKLEPARASTHPPRILLLYGSLRETSYSRLLVQEAERILQHFGAETRVFDPRELPMADSCCGFGGTFVLKNADTSAAMLADKMAAVASTGAQVCTAGDSSCLMHIGGGLSRAGSPVKTVHLAEILAAQ